MMNIRTITTGADLAAVLTTQGVQVTPKAGTPLSKLNQTLLGIGMGVLTGVTAHDADEAKELDPSWMALLVEQSQATLPGGAPTEYVGYLKMLADELSVSVAGTIDFARNVVNPIIKDVADTISTTLDVAGQGGTIAQNDKGVRFALSNGSLVINIDETGPDALYLDAVTESAADARLKIPYNNLRSPVMFPQMTTAELMEFLEENGKSDFQKDVIDLLKGLETGYEDLLNAYNNTFAFQPGRPTGTSISALRNDMSNYPLIILALGLALSEELPEGTTGSAANIENALGDWNTQVKNMIAINIEVYKQALSNKSIVLNSFTNNFETTLVVNKENYRSYLEDDGSTEALLGAAFSDKDYDYDNLLQRKTEYEELYERRVAEAAAYNESNRLAIFKNTLRDQLRYHIFECDEDAIRPVAPSEARMLLEEKMKTIFVDALDRPFETVRTVVCNTLFAGTDAEEILVNIDNVCGKDEGLSVRDAGALVTLDYLAKYLVSQMDVRRIN